MENCVIIETFFEMNETENNCTPIVLRLNLIFNLILESNAEVMYLPAFVGMIIFGIFTLVIERKWSLRASN